VPIKVAKRISGMPGGFTGRAGCLGRGLARIGARAAVERLRQLRGSGNLTAAHGRLAASRLKVTERTVWRWLSQAAGQPSVDAHGIPARRRFRSGHHRA
jgi:hypothetical protein